MSRGPGARQRYLLRTLVMTCAAESGRAMLDAWGGIPLPLMTYHQFFDGAKPEAIDLLNSYAVHRVILRSPDRQTRNRAWREESANRRALESMAVSRLIRIILDSGSFPIEDWEDVDVTFCRWQFVVQPTLAGRKLVASWEV